MKVWTVVNQKGGVGKTTTSISLAGNLAALGYKIVLLDLDPQGSLTHYLGIDAESLTMSAYDLFANTSEESMQVEKALCRTKITNVSLLPSHIALATLDKTMANHLGKGLVIKKALSELEHECDIVIIDCPPVLGVLMVNALVAADKILIPTQTEFLALRGLEQMLSTITQLKQTLKNEVQIMVIATLFDRRVNACLKAYASMRNSYKALLWRGYIPMDTKFRDASHRGLPVNAIASQCRGAYAYDKLSNELLKDAA